MRVILITGEGKGKTTSALGMVLRAVGHGLRVCVVQFIKKDCDTGEAKALRSLPGVDLYICGAGFVFRREGKDYHHHAESAQKGMVLVQQKITEGVDLVVLDEICGAVALGLVKEESVLALLDAAGANTSFILTGRDASQALIDRADTVSSVVCLKHGYEQGLPAQKGIEK
jgi:cob(I)alamin adenosyltransferase